MWRYFLAALVLTQACTAPTPQSVQETQSPTVSAPSTQPAENAPSSTPLPSPSALGPNLLPNPGAELAENPAKPLNWTPDHWGDNQANLSWQSEGAFAGDKYLAVTMANYAEGDAKWIFDAQSLEGDRWYEYSDYYRADGRSRLILGCYPPEGQRRFYTVWQSHESENWKNNTVRFYVSPSYATCQYSLMHVLDRNGYLHTDQHQLRQVEPQPLAHPAVSITFDDIYTSAVDIGAAELEKRGWKGSFYVAGKFARLPDAPEYANVAKIKELIAAGHELGSHSNTHPALSTLNASDLIFEIQSNVDYLKFLGQTPEGMAYPFGDFSEAVEIETKRFHHYARTSLVGLNDANFDPYRLQIFPVTNTTTTLELLNWIDDAERTNTWLILLFHDLADRAEASTYTTGVIQYRQVLDYLKTRKNIQVLSIKEALAQFSR